MGRTNIVLGRSYSERYRNKTGFLSDFGVKVAAAGFAAVLTFFAVKEYRKDPYVRHTACEYTVQHGDSLTSILHSEGLRGSELDAAVRDVCIENYDNMMQGDTHPQPVFPRTGDPDCSMMMPGGKINVPDYDGDGEINRQKCRFQ
jgi:hypothetical protein